MSRWERFVFATDVHGDMQDQGANKAFFKFMDIWKPKHRVMGGDLFDFRPLRRKADAEERRDSVRADYRMGMEWMAKFKPTVFLRGNHDERLWDWASWGSGPASDLAIDCIADLEKKLKLLGCRIMLPYNKREGVYQLGHLKMLHGFVIGVNAARRSAQAYGSCLIGHGHGIQHVSIEGIENRMGRMVGCLCRLDMPYNRAAMASLSQRHGWGYGVINRQTGNYYALQAERINDTWIVPSDMVRL